MLTHHHREADRRSADAVTPRTDLVETPERFLLYMDLPGVPRDRISVRMTDGTLTVTGIPEQVPPRGRKILRSEVGHAAFQRHIRLSEEVMDTSSISARLDNGVLSVTIPKRRTDSNRRRRIPVRRLQ